MKKLLYLTIFSFLSITFMYGQAETITDNAEDLSILKLKNTTWVCDQTTALEFWNGGNKNYPTSRIVSKMDGCGTQGEALLFETETAGDSSPSTKMIIKNNGNIGIGTITPAGTLHVHDSNDGTDVDLRIEDGTNAMLQFSDGVDDTGYLRLDGPSGDLIISKSSTNNDLVIDDGGNVGIGNSSPSSKLDIYDANFDLSILKLRNGSWACNQRTAIEFWNGDSKNHPTSRIVSKMDGCGTQGEALLFETQTAGETDPTAKMIIKNNGYIGIGTTDPDAKLAVNGTVHAKEVKVDLNGWPDFVFKKNYPLPTLAAVETHIKENGHLKDIPSEAEVKENGINLGEMDAKLLQKIEELTLYTIEQDKTLKEQKQFMEAQQKQLRSLQKQVNELKQQTKNK